MPPSLVETELLRVLSRLEAGEERLLAWGMPDVACDQQELEEMVVAEMPNQAPADVIQELLRRSWIRRLGLRGYRSRSAETVRLLARLRQMFEKEQWETGLPLVADFRYRSAPRRVPVRTMGAEEAQKTLPTELRARFRIRETLPQVLGNRRLSAFQSRALLDLLGGVDSAHDGATIVTAGTGAGKTLCFYLPALLARLADVECGRGPYIVAIYPRIELLKDQAQSATEEAQRVRDLARKVLGRPIALGAYYGDTPGSSQWMPQEAIDSGEWECPFMKCWKCSAPLIWKRHGLDWHGQVEGLVCQSGCGVKLGADEVRLTRESMSKSPPDIVFTTMESLNNLLQNTWNGACVGVSMENPVAPRFVLLDEVHTYGGVTGAQQAMVLRRWRHALGRSGHCTQFVGLSATIRDPKQFMSALVGVPEAYVRHVEPRNEEMEETSRRYHLALRGDPISASALLSTSIQSLMLLSRMIDPPNHGKSETNSVFGRKVFAFCDTLDVWRRLFDNLEDAETNLRLPSLRARSPQEERTTRARREDLGQLWGMSQDIGHDLTQAARVDAVSSILSGVASAADVVVATSSLELGFDDPEVGVVLQHKAPRDPASFVQRMGRAGRRPEMRPWIVCVLSDYGRDRLAYAAFEELFEPVLGRNALPVSNRYILRMQGSLALCDWLSQGIYRSSHGSPLRINGIGSVVKAQDGKQAASRKELQASLLRLMASEEVRNSFCDHLRRALRIERDVALDIMWQPPRGLITEMVPTLLRILEGGGSGVEAQKPLGAFIPDNLFSSLMLPQVQIEVPGRSKSEGMPAAQAIRDFAAGRVNRRFAEHARGSHWIAPAAWKSMHDVKNGKVDMQLTEIALVDQLDPLGSWECLTSGKGELGEVWESVPVFFPRNLKLRTVPADVSVSSNAIPIWHSQIVCARDAQYMATPKGSALHNVLPRLDFLLHSDNRSVTVRRFTTGSIGTVSSAGIEPRREAFVQVTYRHPDSPGSAAALGMQAEVDALALDLQIPASIEQGWQDLSSEAGRARRVEFYRRRVQDAFRKLPSETGHYVSTFAVDRLLDLFLAGIAARARKLGTLAGAVAEAQDPVRAAMFMKRTQDVMLRSIEVVEGEQGAMGRLGARIEPLAKDPVVLRILVRQAAILHEGIASAEWRADFLAWMRVRTLRGVLEAVLESIRSLLPDFDIEDLHVDIDAGAYAAHGDAAHKTCCWISESEPGGTGTLDALRKCYLQDPDRFMAVLAEAVRVSPEDFASESLSRVLQLLVEDAVMQDLATACRAACSHAQAQESAERLVAYLEEQGMVVGHSLRSSVFLRFLRPGSSLATDRVTHAIHQMWTQMSVQLGVEVDSRCVAYIAAKDSEVENLMQSAWPGQHSETWRFNQAYSLLWPTTRHSRLQRFQGWQPYLSAPPSDPDALLPALPVHPRVDVADERWFEQFGKLIDQRETRVDLVAAHDQQELLRAALLRLAASPHDVEALHLHAEVEALARTVDRRWLATVRIPDVFA